MQLNLPILDPLTDKHNILIAGAGGGFDVFGGLPIYFMLREMGKNVHLANYSFSEFELVKLVSQPEVLIEGLLIGARGSISHPLMYYPEGYLSRWFEETQNTNVTVWMFNREGVEPLKKAYTALIQHLKIDALILIDGGVDSLSRGDEEGSGTLVEDSITLAAVQHLDIPTKILGCIGFGTEAEEAVCHYSALENIAALAKAGAFLGSCALTPQMPAFQLYEDACRYVWEQPGHTRSHISTRIIPAVHGEFGDYRMYRDGWSTAWISPLMGLYWFFDADTVAAQSLLVPMLAGTTDVHQAIRAVAKLKHTHSQRPRRIIPY
jgi:hypothetical protein